MNELALFAGAGGGILGGHLLGWRTVCAVERDAYAAGVLLARQNDGCLPPFPVWDDVCTFDGRPWRGLVDVASGGFPCQDISVAGKGAGLSGERSGLWFEMSRIVGEVRPRFVFVENSPALTRRGGVRVVADLAAMGYRCRWGIVAASDVGAPHKRERIWIVANADVFGGNENSSHGKLWANRLEQSPENSGIAYSTQRREIAQVGNSNGAQLKRGGLPSGIYPQYPDFNRPSSWWDSDPADAPESGVGRVANGVAARLDRLRAIGNGQVPAVAATAFLGLRP